MLDKIMKWDRFDYAFTRAALILVGVAVPALTVGRTLYVWLTGRAVEATVRAEKFEDLPASLLPARDGAELTWEGTFAVTLQDPPTSVHVTQLLAGLVVSVIVLAAVAVLWRLLSAVQSGQPFQARVVRSLHLLAALSFVSALVTPSFNSLAGAEVIRAATTASVPMSMTLSFAGVAAGLGLLLLAEAFRQGQRLADDVDGLV